MAFHAYGITPTDKKVLSAIKAVRDAYKPLPETTCGHRACCCNAGNPNMYYSEFLSIREGVVDKLPKEERLNLTIECIKRYLINQGEGVTKPCVFLAKDNLCKLYNVRPLKCRTYGIIPESLYNWIVDEVSKDTKIPKEKLPLCVQCPFVNIKPEYKEKFPDGKLTEKMIKDLERILRETDRKLGISKYIQDKGFSFLTYHDWHIMFEMGEEWMANLTTLRTGLTQEQKDSFVETLKKTLEKLL